MGSAQTLTLDRAVLIALGGWAAWARGNDVIDDQHLFRVAVVIAIVGVVCLKGAAQLSRPKLSYGVAVALLLVPVLGPSLSLGWLAYRLFPRWPLWVLVLLTLPLDPWFAETLAWPLRRMTALVGGVLSFSLPYDSTGTWLAVDCRPFCEVGSHGGREPFRINDKCAGLAQVESMLALIAAMLLVAINSFRQRAAILLLLAAPLIAVLVNGVRVAMSVWVGRWLDRGPWEGWIHDLPAFICFGLLIYALLQLVRSFEQDPNGKATPTRQVVTDPGD